MNNNLKRIEKELRSFVKRCKDIKYNTALLFSFLVTGSLSLSANGKDDVETAKRGLQTSITDMKKLFKEAKAENDKLMKGSNLELVQLMEQGDHVVKSPWSSWQFGMNGFYNNWRGTYKGRGDKADKYAYEGILTRDTNLFNRYVPVSSSNYSLLSTGSDPRSASSNLRNGIKSYGLSSTRLTEEPPLEISANAGINPKNVNKIPLNITAKTANSPTLPEAVKFAPIDPTIVIPDDPYTPDPPTFAVILGADCNNGCSSNSNPRQQGQGAAAGKYPGMQNLNAFLHYTWTDSDVPDVGTKGLAFKMYAETNGTADFVLGTTAPTVNNSEILTTKDWYFNSYNTGTEFASPINNSYQSGNDKNHQPFFVGGSRFIEADNASTGTNHTKIEIPDGHTVNLAGILTLALVSQGDATYQINAGTITDKKEKEDQYIKEILGNYSDVNTQAQKAVLAANEAGGRDNITVAIAKYLVREEVA